MEGALLAALVALLGVLSFYTGFGWLQPIPVLLASVRHGPRNGLLVTVVGSGLLALWIGPVAAVGSLAFVAALGLVPGFVLVRFRSAMGAVAAMTLALLLSGLLGAAAALLLWHTNLWLEAWRNAQRFLQQHAAEIRTLAGMTPQQLGALVLRALPVMAAVAAAVQACGVYLLSAAVLRRLGYRLPGLEPRTWRAPRWVLGVYAVASVTLLLGRTGPHIVGTVALNLYLGLGLVYTLVGGAAAYGWLRAQGLGRPQAAVAVVGGFGLMELIGLAAAPPVIGVLASLTGPATDPHAPHEEGESR